MTTENPLEAEISLPDTSETSSASPVYSGGSSEPQDELSSVETTPPPMPEGYPVPVSKRYSTSSNGFSRSYRSVQSSYADSIVSPAFPPQRLSGVSDFRPSTAGTEDGALAAATAGLNFSTTPRTSSIPPVPPVPQQYLGQSFSGKSPENGLNNVYSPLGMHAFSHNVSDERHHRHDSRPTSQYDEEGMFKMEE